MAHSNTGRPKKGKRRATHPYLAKYPEFPLSFNKSNNQWYKTIKGRRHYFGTEPVEARRRYEEALSYLVRGEQPPQPGGMTVGDLFDLYLEDREKDLEVGGIKPRTFRDYCARLKFVAGQLGRSTPVEALNPARFKELRRAIEKRHGSSPTVVTATVNIAKLPFSWADDEGLHDKPKWGKAFKGASKREIRQKRKSYGRQTFNPDEIRALLDAASPLMRAAILVGINGGYTQDEVSKLRRVWLDRETGILDHQRSKTLIDRRVPLWTETLEAIDALPVRQPDKDAKGLIFVTRTGKSYTTDKGDNGIGQSFSRLMKKVGIQLDHVGFGKFRATFETVSDEAGDRTARDICMGHVIEDGGIGEHYNRFNDDDRLRAVVDHVHGWLFG